MKLRNPQFEGQTKTKLGNTEIRSFVEKVTNEKLADWLEEHPTEAQGDRREGDCRPRTGAHRGAPGARPHPAQVAARVGVDAGQARRLLVAQPRRGRAVHRRGRQRRRQREEGAQPAFQAILPIRGKILNVERARIDRMLRNEEIQALISAVGTGIGEEFDIDEAPLPQDHHDDRRRRRRLAHPHAAAHVLLPPAARDRAAAATCTSRSRRCTAPRSARTSARTSRTRPRSRAFEAEHEGRKIEISRFKGLGEMDWQELGETTMNPATRTLLQVSVEDAAIADEIFSTLMGEDVEPRRGVHPGRTPKTSASSTSDRRPRPTPNPRPACLTNRRRRSATSNRSRSRRRWNAPSSTTRCRSSRRARLPDARDGLKPVQRRILYGMYDEGMRPDRQHRKSRERGRRRDGATTTRTATSRSTTRSRAWRRTSRCATR